MGFSEVFGGGGKTVEQQQREAFKRQGGNLEGTAFGNATDMAAKGQNGTGEKTRFGEVQTSHRGDGKVDVVTAQRQQLADNRDVKGTAQLDAQGAVYRGDKDFVGGKTAGSFEGNGHDEVAVARAKASEDLKLAFI